jgi:hypothetical protein
MGAAVLTVVAGSAPAVATTAAGAVGVTVGPMLRAPGHSQITAAAQGSAPVLLSTNWSGYAATSTTSAKFDSVQSDFVQPSIVCTGATGRFVAVWVGLDGFKNQTVEQDGTYATCSGRGHKTPTYVAWYEMYPAGSVNVFSVNAGDEIVPVVTYADGTFTLSIADTTSGQSKSITATCAKCHRASAEWIVERPELCTKKGSCFLTGLPDFSSATMATDTAGTDVAPPAPVSSFTNTPIDMIQPVGTAVELLDQTSPLDPTGTSFSATWERAGGRLSL